MKPRYFVSIIGVTLLLLLGIWAISSLFSGGSNKPKKNVPVPKTLVDYADSNATVSFRIKGIDNGDEIHREIEVIIGRDSRTVNVIQGYQNTIVRSQNYYNNLPAFDEFLHAIARANFTKARKNVVPKDERGVCPLGNRYDLKLTQDGKDISSLWSATCSGVGTSGANPQLLIQLFENQIPNYSQLTHDVNLNATAATSNP